MSVPPRIDVDLRGQVAFVTGAGRGIGRALAAGFAASGASVVLLARTEAQVVSAAADIRARGGDARAVVADVADAAAMERAVEMTVDELGRIDIVVANAGAVAPETRTDPVSDFDYVIEVNLTSVHRLARSVEPHLRVRGGKFIAMGSGAGRRPFPGGAAYSVSKAGLSMLVRSLAVEWRSSAIAVNEIVPGPVTTEMARAVFVGELPEALRLEWHKSPEDVVPLALFLAAQSNAGPTGQTFSLLGRDG